MNAPALIVHAPGLFTTVQDFGRVGFQAQGMPVAGALDPLGLEIANRLCGNAPGEAALELRYLGPLLEVAAPKVRFGLAGPVQAERLPADGTAARPLQSYASHTLVRGDRLRIGSTGGVAVACLAVAGGFDLPEFMGSRSTYTRAGLGGFHGRSLQAGDHLPLRVDAPPAAPDLMLDPAAAERLYGSGPVRVVTGPQADRFSPAALAGFLAAEYRITPDADRMGLRLDGPPVAHLAGADIASEGIACGAIQVPGNGKPIILLADRQTTGGYTKIATVISADLPRVARGVPGSSLRFQAVSVAEAEGLRRAQAAQMHALLGSLRPQLPDGGIDLHALYRENLIGGAVDARTGGHE